MTLIRIRLGDTDRQRYEVDEHLVLDVEALKDMGADELETLERTSGLPIAPFLPMLEGRLTEIAQPRRVAVWLALRQAGRDVPWEECTPQLLRAEFVQEFDTDPLVGPSESSSEDDTSPTS